MADNQKKVLDTMKGAGKPLGPSEIVKLSGLSKEEVSEAMKLLKKSEKIASPVRCKWAPSE